MLSQYKLEYVRYFFEQSDVQVGINFQQSFVIIG